MTKYRVEVCYRYKKAPGGVRLGMTVEAESEDDAIDKAIAKHITPFKSRVHLQTTAEISDAS
jgi:hypothetical protein